MNRTRKLLTAAVLGLLAVALVAGLAITSLNQPSAIAAPLPQAVTTTAPTTPSTNSGANTKGQYRDAFKQAFASRLGVDSSKLDSAYAGAVGDVVDQAVKDGKLTQAQADKIKAAAAKNGFKGVAFGQKKGANGKNKAEKVKALSQTVINAAATPLNLTGDQLKTELKSGKSIADVAQSKNVDIKTVKDAILAAIKTGLDSKVKDGKLTQAQADKAYQAAANHIDQIVNHKGGAHKGKDQKNKTNNNQNTGQ